MNSAIRIVLRWKNLLTSMELKKKKNETNNQNQVKPEKSQTSAYFQEHKSNPEILLFSATVTAVYGIGKILFGKVSSAGLETVL